MGNEIQKQQAGGQVAEIGNDSSAMIQMIERMATNPDVDVSKVEKMLDMQERIMDRSAKQAFHSALAQAQQDLPVVTEDKEGHNNRYASLENIVRTIRPVLHRYGLAVTFRNDNSQNGFVTSSAILSHCDGHSESTSVTLPYDTTGSKNPSQAIGSSISYGKRYALCALLGIATGNDDDGNGAHPQQGGQFSQPVQLITDEQIAQLQTAIDNAGKTTEEFCHKAGVASLADMPAQRFSGALNYLKQQGAKQ